MTSRIEQVIREIQQLRDFYNKTEALRNKIKSKTNAEDHSGSDKNINLIKETPKEKYGQKKKSKK